MLKNYFKIALRNFRRSPGYAFINVAGLALGIACCLLIGLYVQDELSYDRFHEKGDRIYRINQRVARPGAEEVWNWTGAGLGNDLRNDFPTLEAVVRFHRRGGVVQYITDQEPAEIRSFREGDFFFADTTVFDVFSYAFLQGHSATAFRQPGSVVLTRSTATRYFGDGDPMGKTLMYDGRLPLQVTGVIEDVPLNSHLRFDMLAPFAAFKQHHGIPVESELGSYWWPSVYTYVLLSEHVSAEQIQEQLPAFSARHRDAEEASTFIPALEPLYDLHLRSEAEAGAGTGGSQAMVNTFTLIALAILLLACINFMNLSTARSARRAREVGVRKCIGARRIHLVVQFLGESLLMSLVALVLAVGLVELLLPLFNDLTAKNLSVGYAGNKVFWGGLVALIVFTGLVAGSYPALVLSGFRPVRVLKNSFSLKGRRTWAYKGLVVFQFAISIALIAGAFIAASQLNYMRNAQQGFEEEQVVSLRLPDGEQWETLKNELLAQAEVLDVSASTVRPGFGRGTTLPYEAEGALFEEGEEPQIGLQFVDYRFFEMLGLELVAGRSFSHDYPSDVGTGPEDIRFFHLLDRGVVINEAAARQAGWSPEEALGKKMRVYALENGTYFTDVRGTVVGVVQDYHYNPLHYKIRPAMFSVSQTAFGHYVSWALVKVVPDREAQTVDALRAVWQGVLPDQPFEISFLDQDLDNRYIKEARVGKIIGAFAFLGIVIACLGLFGLAAYAAEQRTKEIGIRKVLGASVPTIFALLSREFLVLVLVSAVIAVPLTYFPMVGWLRDFAYRIEVGPLLFVGVILLAFIIALLTIGYQSVKAAMADPVESLRYE
ncbi:MAG: ABC transporter permease [Rhodothermales bacterium]